MPKNIGITRVSKGVLDSIILGSFDRELSTEERALLETVQEGKRPWFERVVVSEYYLALRGVVRSYPIRQNEGHGTQFLQMLINHFALVKLTENDRKVLGWSTPLMRTYEKNTAKPFEVAVEDALRDHRKAVVTLIKNAVDNEFRFPYLPLYSVIVALREKILR